MTKTVLIVGGTSGLGLSLASLFASQACDVYATGRTNPENSNINYCRLEIDADTLAADLDALVASLPDVDMVVYAAGFYEEASIAESSDEFIVKMDRVGLLAPMLLIAKIARNQGHIPEFIAITSTSQWTPRLLEPTYSAVKAGLGMFANSLSLDPVVGKVLVVGVAGMATPFWKSSGRDVTTMLHPDWVAEQVLDQLLGDYRYKLIKVLRSPQRVEVFETR